MNLKKTRKGGKKKNKNIKKTARGKRKQEKPKRIRRVLPWLSKKVKFIRDKRKFTTIEPLLSETRKISNQSFFDDFKKNTLPRKGKETKIENQNCGICLDTLYSRKTPFKKLGKKIQTKCNHVFHKRCLKKWLDKHNNCPVCREQLKEEDYEEEDEDENEDEVEETRSPRLIKQHLLNRILSVNNSEEFNQFVIDTFTRTEKEYFIALYNTFFQNEPINNENYGSGLEDKYENFVIIKNYFSQGVMNQNHYTQYNMLYV